MEEEQLREQKELEDFLNSQMEDWGSREIAVREQEDKIRRSKLGKIDAKSRSNKREQEEEPGTVKKRKKRLKLG